MEVKTNRSVNPDQKYENSRQLQRFSLIMKPMTPNGLGYWKWAIVSY